VRRRRRESIRFRIDNGREEPARRRQLRLRLLRYLAALAVLFATALAEVVWRVTHLRLSAAEAALALGMDVIAATALAAMPLWVGTWFRRDRIFVLLGTALVLWASWQGLPAALDDVRGTQITSWARALGSLPIGVFNLWLIAPRRHDR
jgi:hypothetical protein